MTRRDLIKYLLTGGLLLALHVHFLSESFVQTSIFLTSLLVVLPCSPVIATAGNLLELNRWMVYYAIWFQLMPERYSVAWGIPNLGSELLVFFAMELFFSKYLQKTFTVGLHRVPLGVYLSSWVSNARLVSFLSFHKAVEADNENANSNNQTDNNVHDQERPLPLLPTETTTTAVTSTPAPTTTPSYLKYTYSIFASLLVINILLTFATRFRSYYCFDCSPANAYAPFLFPFPPGSEIPDDIRRHLVMNNDHMEYCYSDDIIPGLGLNYLSAIVVALAWSTIPTKVVARAWMRMWNSSSTSDRHNSRLPRLRKVYYVLFMLPLKITLFILPLLTTTPKQTPIDATSIQPALLITWSIIFTHLAKLAFGLTLIWNLYMVHSNPGEVMDLEVEIEHGLVEQWGGSCYQIVDQKDDIGDDAEEIDEKAVVRAAAADVA
ncbi:hypothetical protein EC991_004314 [Linnemannia zychae]|nr:hypothetical protein EC991_004314 [Linnemannia zychae]